MKRALHTRWCSAIETLILDMNLIKGRKCQMSSLNPP